MSRKSFENYGKKAKNFDSYLHIASRFEFMKESEDFIIKDIFKKLKLNNSDEIIDIGCGAGNLTIPLNAFVSHTSCIDHANCLDRLKSRLKGTERIKLIPGNFLDLKINKIFDKVLCYSVIHYLKDDKEVWDFISKALDLIKPGGLALFGDLPNRSKKERFISTEFGRKIDKEYQHSIRKNNLKVSNIEKLPQDTNLVEFNDELILKLIKEIRNKGLNAFLVEQPSQLSLSYTREDIVVSKPLP